MSSTGDRWRRAAGVGVLVCATWYLPWLLGHLDLRRWWVSIPFAAASCLLVLVTLLTWINDWTRSTPPSMRVARGDEPPVAVLVPTAGEPPEMVRATAASVLAQDWPVERLLLLVGDDAGTPGMTEMVDELARNHPGARVHLYRAPRRGDPARRGEAKAGNLNGALDELAVLDPAGDVRWVETRDADDLVGDPAFLRRVVAALLDDPGTAYVQTVKEANVAPGDPFGNLDTLFYRGNMLARHAAGAVFPCGSGLVWRREALEDIGGFPVWNLVEDLQSGLEALRRGWRGQYVPIVGAHGQVAPEDIANVYKQRGTWALDTVRLLVWGDWAGVNLRQRLHFFELGLFYLYSIATLVFFTVPMLGLVLGAYPLVAGSADYALHFWPVTVAIEVFLVTLNAGGRWEDLWRARQMWAGMAPVYAVSAVRAIAYGPRRKPVYRLTRKTHHHVWYWRETLPQSLLLLALVASVVYAVANGSLLRDVDLGSAYWALVGILLLGGFVAKGWYGVLGRPRTAMTSPAGPHRIAPGQAEPGVVDVRDAPTTARADHGATRYRTPV